MYLSRDNYPVGRRWNDAEVPEVRPQWQAHYSWGTFGVFPGGMWGPHQFTVDSDGNLYIAETFGGRVQKFRPKKGADPNKLITPPLKTSSR